MGIYKKFEKFCFDSMDKAIKEGKCKLREDLKSGKIDNLEFAVKMDRKNYQNYLKK